MQPQINRPFFQYQAAFDAIIDAAEQLGYIHAQYMRLDVMSGAFQRLIDGSIRDGTSADQTTIEVIDMILPALVMVDKMGDHDFGLEVQYLLVHYGYPHENHGLEPEMVDDQNELTVENE